MNKTSTGLTAPNRILHSWAIPIVIAIVAVFTYLNGINGEFVFDDIPLVQTDQFYTDTDTSWLDCWNRCYWREEMAIGQHRPLTLLSFLINTRLSGIYSPAFRVLNLILHVIVTLLVFKLALKLRLGRIFAIFAALLFAVLPLHAEAVIPTTGRAELLCGLFIILGLIFHISSYKTGDQSNLDSSTSNDQQNGRPHRDAPTLLFPILTAICFLLACWSKENGVILLPLCILYDFFYQFKFKFLCDAETNDECSIECPICIIIKKYWGFIIALGIAILTRVNGTGMLLPKLKEDVGLFVDNPLIGVPIITRILTAFHVQGMVIYKFFWPEILSHDYSYKQIMPIETIADPFAILAICCFFVLPVILCFIIPKRKDVILFFWGAYIVSILPAGNFLTPTGTILGERLYYTPSIFLIFISLYILFILIKQLKIQFPAARTVMFGILVIAIIASIFRIYIRAEDFRNPYTLRLSAVKTSPNSIKTWNNLGIAYRVRGENKKALAAFNEALKIQPDHISSLTNRIDCFLYFKQYSAAEQDLREIIKIGTSDPQIYNRLGGIMIEKGKLQEAKILWDKSLELKPDQDIIINALRELEKDIKLKNSN